MPELDKLENTLAAENALVSGVMPAVGDPVAGEATIDDSAADCDDKSSVVLVYMTFPTMAIAELVANDLVSAGLAACVNIIPGMVSIYLWQGARHRDDEVVLIVKTRRDLADTVMARTRPSHPYDNPAMLVLAVAGGSRAFLDWIATQTSKGMPQDGVTPVDMTPVDVPPVDVPSDEAGS